MSPSLLQNSPRGCAVVQTGFTAIPIALSHTIFLRPSPPPSTFLPSILGSCSIGYSVPLCPAVLTTPHRTNGAVAALIAHFQLILIFIRLSFAFTILVSPRYPAPQYPPIHSTCKHPPPIPPPRSHSSFSQFVQHNNVHTYCSIHNAVSVVPALCTLAGELYRYDSHVSLPSCFSACKIIYWVSGATPRMATQYTWRPQVNCPLSLCTRTKS